MGTTSSGEAYNSTERSTDLCFLDTALVNAKTRSFGQVRRLVGIRARPAVPLTGFALDL